MTESSDASHNRLTTRAHNRRLLLLRMLRRQPISRVRLARETGLSTTTVTNLVTELINNGYVQEVGTDMAALAKGAGRPPLALALVPDSAHCLGIHVGVRHMRVALCNLAAEIKGSRTLDVDPSQTPAENLYRAADAGLEIIRSYSATQAASDANILGIGVGASGIVDVPTGVNLLAPNLKWRNVPIPKLLGEYCSMPVAVDNNVRCMALSESIYGLGRNKRALAFIYARIGVGAGLVVDGRIYHGSGYGAGEIGHWTMWTVGKGEGRRPVSLEDLISEREIVERARALAPEMVDGAPEPLHAIFFAVRNGHVLLRGLLDEVAYYTGIALANLVDVLNPQLVLLGGLLHEGYDLFRDTIIHTMRQFAFGGLGHNVEIHPATFGAQCGEVGAAVLALDHFFYSAAK